MKNKNIEFQIGQYWGLDVIRFGMEIPPSKIFENKNDVLELACDLFELVKIESNSVENQNLGKGKYQLTFKCLKSRDDVFIYNDLYFVSSYLVEIHPSWNLYWSPVKKYDVKITIGNNEALNSLEKTLCKSVKALSYCEAIEKMSQEISNLVVK